MPNDDVVFFHDRAPCMSALETQKLLTDKGIDFFGNSVWPGKSPDLNPIENLGAIVKESPGKFSSLWPITNRPGDERSFSVILDELSGR